MTSKLYFDLCSEQNHRKVGTQSNGAKALEAMPAEPPKEISLGGCDLLLRRDGLRYFWQRKRLLNLTGLGGVTYHFVLMAYDYGNESDDSNKFCKIISN